MEYEKIIIILFIIITIIIFGLLFVYKIHSYKSALINTQDMQQIDPNLIRNILNNDAYLHRLLMIELITHNSSNITTFNTMITNINLLNIYMTYSFGPITSKKITTLLGQRNNILRDHYYTITNFLCNIKDGENMVKNNKDIKDIEMSTCRNLELLTAEIMTNIYSMFKIHDIKINLDKQRLYNLILMYDKELINEALSYITENYDTSINHFQSSSDIMSHISNELCILMNHTQPI